MESEYNKLIFELWEITREIEKIDVKKYWLAEFKIIVAKRNKIVNSLKNISK